MTQETLTAVIHIVPTAILALSGLLVSIINRGGIKDLHVQINSRMEKWLTEARAAARAEGHSAGMRDEHNRRKGDPR